MTMFTEALKTGAAHVRRLATKNPMEVLRKIIEQDVTADNDRRFKKWDVLIMKDPELLLAVKQYAFKLWNTQLERDMRAAKAAEDTENAENAEDASPLKRRTKAELEEEAAPIVSRAQKILVLDIVMPNNKRLRECTGQYGKSLGGWIARIAGKVKPTDIIGTVVSDDQAQKLWRER